MSIVAFVISGVADGAAMALVRALATEPSLRVHAFDTDGACEERPEGEGALRMHPASEMDAFMRDNVVETLVLGRHVHALRRFAIRARRVFLWLDERGLEPFYDESEPHNQAVSILMANLWRVERFVFGGEGQRAELERSLGRQLFDRGVVGPCGGASDEVAFWKALLLSEPPVGGTVAVAITDGLGNNLYQIAALFNHAVASGDLPLLERDCGRPWGGHPSVEATCDWVGALFPEIRVAQSPSQGRAVYQHVVQREGDLARVPRASAPGLRLRGYFFGSGNWLPSLDVVRAKLRFADEVLIKARGYHELLGAAVIGQGQPTIRIGVHMRFHQSTDHLPLDLSLPLTPALIGKVRAHFTGATVHFVACSNDVARAEAIMASVPSSPAFSVVPEGSGAATEMAILARCDHVVLSVSTFGMWAALLNPLVAPTRGCVFYPRRITTYNYHYCAGTFIPPLANWLCIDDLATTTVAS